jgi:hypothetical protein
VLPNQASYYYLSERSNPTRFVVSAMIVTEAHRKEVLEDLRASPLRYVVRDQRGLHVDGLSERLVLGAATVDWLAAQYEPLENDLGFEILAARPERVTD